MKKGLLILLAAGLLLMLAGCQKPLSDEARFKAEYEALNNRKSDGMTLSEIQIDAASHVRYVDLETLLTGLENGTHVVYLGDAACPWCRRAMECLSALMKDYKGLSIYYYPLLESRKAYEADSESTAAQPYRKVIEILNQDESLLEGMTDYYEDGALKLPASLILFIKGGQLVGAHRRTVESHIDPYEPLTAEQKEELEAIYRGYLDDLSQYNPVYCSGCD